jgi:hypothetical protein
MSYSVILDTYSLEEIFELNSVTEEEALEFLVTQGFLDLPELKPLEFE